MSLLPATNRIAGGHRAGFYIDDVFVGDIMGPVDKPGVDHNDNFQAVEGIGWYKDLAQVPGRIEVGLRTRVQLTKIGAWKKYILRRYNDDPIVLPTFTAKVVTPQVTQTMSECRLREFRMQFQEMQTCTVNLDIWPRSYTETDGANSIEDSQDATVYRWHHVQSLGFAEIADAAATIRAYLSSVNIGITNNLERVGQGTDRFPVEITELMEKLQISYNSHTHWNLAAMDGNRKLGASTLIATGADPTGAAKTLTITIDHNHLSQLSGQEAGANAILAFSANVAGHAIQIDES